MGFSLFPLAYYTLPQKAVAECKLLTGHAPNMNPFLLAGLRLKEDSMKLAKRII